MATTLSYRKATSSDLAFLIQLRKLTMSEHLAMAGIYYTEKQHIERIEEYFDDSQLILLNGKEIGLLKLGRFHGRLDIRQFQILPQAQGKGIGSKVLMNVINKAQARNLSVTLNVLHANPALKLYQRVGFTIIGENELEYQMCYKKKGL